jgi:hypothetical protein
MREMGLQPHSITLSQLRFKKLWLPWIKAGERVELRSRKTVVGYIVPPSPDRAGLKPKQAAPSSNSTAA